jgi:hypothetical protein
MKSPSTSCISGRSKVSLPAGTNGRVGGEDALLLDVAAGGVEVDAGRDQLAHQLERQERRVAFVQVIRVRVDAEGAQRAHPADAEHGLLHDAGAGVAAVEVRGDPAVDVLVAVAIGVEEVERNPPDVGAPDLHAHRARTDRHLDRERLVGLVA